MEIGYSQGIFRKELAFRQFQVWPYASRLDVRRWLANFAEEDHPFAIKLAEGFCYYHDPLFAALMRASLQDLSNRLSISGDADAAEITSSDCVAFVKIEGERPNSTDSGNLVTRKIHALGANKGTIFSPREALAAAHRFRHFVFVDDIVGSGSQMLTTWKRVHQFGEKRISFETLAADGHGSYACCVAFVTALGAQTLAQEVPLLSLHAPYLLEERVSYLHKDHPIWREWPMEEGLAFIRHYGRKAGYTSDDGNIDCWAGFNWLAMGIAFEHGVPDCTLPIFHSTRIGWQPLVRMTA